MDNQQGPIVEHMELYSMLCASLVGSGSSGEKRYMYVYDWVPLLFGYTPIKNKKFKFSQEGGESLYFLWGGRGS